MSILLNIKDIQSSSHQNFDVFGLWNLLGHTKCVQAVQGHPRSMILVPIEITYVTSYWSVIIVTLVLSRTISEIRWLPGWKLLIFHTPLSFGVPTPYKMWNFLGERPLNFWSTFKNLGRSWIVTKFGDDRPRDLGLGSEKQRRWGRPKHQVQNRIATSARRGDPTEVKKLIKRNHKDTQWPKLYLNDNGSPPFCSTAAENDERHTSDARLHT